MDLASLQSLDPQILVGVAVAVLAVGVGAVFLFSSKKSKGCLDPENFKGFKLVKRNQLSHNVAKFTFELPTPTSVLGLPIGQHISCRGKDSQGEDVIKPYTPCTLDSDIGHFELVIKMYPQGRMSHHFREIKVGDYLSVKGPKGRFKYQPGQVRAFGMLAGGSGITPMFQVARAILENPEDTTKVYLIYANVTYEDILLKEELDTLASKYADRFKVYYVLNQPPEAWDGGVGFVTKEMIQAHCPAPASDIQGGHARQELYYLLKDEKDVHFQFGSVQKDGINKASQGMHSSKFCLNIAGDTPSSNRLFDAIASHCVPVIISDDIELPYEDVLDYSAFCIFVRTSDAVKGKFLVNLIRSISRDEWTRMWQRLKEVENYFEFQYPSRENDAVQMIWQAVARKAPAIRMKVHRSRRYSRSVTWQSKAAG